MSATPEVGTAQATHLNRLALRLLGWLLVFGAALDLALLGAATRLSDVAPGGITIIGGVGVVFAVVGAIALVMSRHGLDRGMPSGRLPVRQTRRWRAAIICAVGFAALAAALKARGL